MNQRGQRRTQHRDGRRVGDALINRRERRRAGISRRQQFVRANADDVGIARRNGQSRDGEDAVADDVEIGQASV